MALIPKKQAPRENSIENSGRWPIRLTDFHLVDDYEFPPSDYCEIFLARSGSFLHETDNGTQALRAGTAMVHHPSARHVVKRPDNVRLTRVRFLPEWFAADHPDILESPDTLGLVFARPWFKLAVEHPLQVFTTRDSQMWHLESALDFLAQTLAAGRHASPVARVTLLHVFLMLGDEYHVYWRGGNRLAFPQEALAAVDLLDHAAASGFPVPESRLQERTGMDAGALDDLLRKSAGATAEEYAWDRRLQHAAARLIASELSVDAIAGSLGFPGLDEFRDRFEKRFKLGPDTYRMKFRTA